MAHIRPHEIAHHFARPEVLKEPRRVLVVIGPVHQVGDLKLHGHAHGQQANGRRPPARDLVGGLRRTLQIIGDQEVRLIPVALVPQHVSLPLLAGFLGETHIERLNLLRAEAIDLIDRPRPFQVCPGAERRAALDALAEMLEQPLLARFDEHHAGR